MDMKSYGESQLSHQAFGPIHEVHGHSIVSLFRVSSPG